MHCQLFRLALVVTVLQLAPARAGAQAIAAPSLTGPRVERVQAFRVVRPENGAAGPVLQAVDRKDPLVAGILSWLVPGVGSFYAGNSGHGIRHLVIEVGGIVLFVAGVAYTLNECDPSGSFCTLTEGSTALILAGAGVLVVNGIWSIITAVGDANAHNRGAGGGARPGRVVGSLYVEPNIVSLPNNGAPSLALRQTPSAGLQLLRVEF